MNKLGYIIESYINGNITLSKESIKSNSFKFCGLEVLECCDMFGLRITIKVLKLGEISDMNIINAFYDYGYSEDLQEVKTILLNRFE
tara:strand:+ start:52 stop:312 length:261 start_codon:yes stop_codon:yes gene_type:complete